MAGNGRFIDLMGQQFGLLTVKARAPNLRHKARWVCSCECGGTCVPFTSDLKTGHTKSCGCLKTQGLVSRSTVHGCAGRTTEYASWAAMTSRCLNPNNPKWARYGGRGITVCEDWRDFPSFMKDMGPAPAGSTIERVDNNLGYFKENCVWAGPEAQARNRSSTVHVTYKGETRPLIAWCEHLDLAYKTVYARVQVLLWSVERALETPTTSGYTPYREYIRK